MSQTQEGRRSKIGEGLTMTGKGPHAEPSPHYKASKAHQTSKARIKGDDSASSKSRNRPRSSALQKELRE